MENNIKNSNTRHNLQLKPTEREKKHKQFDICVDLNAVTNNYERRIREKDRTHVVHNVFENNNTRSVMSQSSTSINCYIIPHYFLFCNWISTVSDDFPILYRRLVTHKCTPNPCAFLLRHSFFPFLSSWTQWLMIVWTAFENHWIRSVKKKWLYYNMMMR